MGDEELTSLHLDVYDTKQGPWNPEHGEIEVPTDWEFLPSGDAFVTRTVKAAGLYWLAWRPRGKNRPHRRLLGLWAPRSAVEAARARAAETAETRRRERRQSTRYREGQEQRYREELAAAIVDFLDFAAQYAALAEGIARGAAERWPGASQESDVRSGVGAGRFAPGGGAGGGLRSRRGRAGRHRAQTAARCG
jgi:hypothetical protein